MKKYLLLIISMMMCASWFITPVYANEDDEEIIIISQQEYDMYKSMNMLSETTLQVGTWHQQEENLNGKQYKYWYPELNGEQYKYWIAVRTANLDGIWLVYSKKEFDNTWTSMWPTERNSAGWNIIEQGNDVIAIQVYYGYTANYQELIWNTLYRSNSSGTAPLSNPTSYYRIMDTATPQRIVHYYFETKLLQNGPTVYEDYVQYYQKDYETEPPNYVEPEPEEPEYDGILGAIYKILQKIANGMNNSGYVDIEENTSVVGVAELVSEKLKDDINALSLYNEINDIIKTLEQIFNDDYSNGQAILDETGVFNITLRRPTATYDFGNEIIGEWTQEWPISNIDYGLSNQRTMDLRWFFGVGDVRGIKYYSDIVLGGFMWLVFVYWLWKNFPDLIGGEIGSIVGATGQSIKNYTGTTTITTSTNMETGEMKITKNTTRRDKKNAEL